MVSLLKMNSNVYIQGTWKIVKAVKCGISGIHLVLGTVSLGVGAVSSIPLLGKFVFSSTLCSYFLSSYSHYFMEFLSH